MKTAYQEYQEYQMKARKAEEATGFYLEDECVDRENTYDAGLKDELTEEFWEMMLASGVSSFGSRCEDYKIIASDFGIDY